MPTVSSMSQNLMLAISLSFKSMPSNPLCTQFFVSPLKYIMYTNSTYLLPWKLINTIERTIIIKICMIVISSALCLIFFLGILSIDKKRLLGAWDKNSTFSLKLCNIKAHNLISFLFQWNPFGFTFSRKESWYYGRDHVFRDHLFLVLSPLQDRLYTTLQLFCLMYLQFFDLLTLNPLTLIVTLFVVMDTKGFYHLIFPNSATYVDFYM